MRRFVFFLVIVVLGGSPELSGATAWRVEQDGSGDWTTIQAAVEAAADGDTILIGAGRYSTLFQVNSMSDAVVYWNSEKELFLIGAEGGDTVIGPEEYNATSRYSCGLMYEGSSPLHMRFIWFDNMDYGVLSGAENVDIEDCMSTNCGGGLRLFYANEGYIRNCAFSLTLRTDEQFAISLHSSDSVVIENCSFRDMRIYQDTTEGTTVRNCSFVNTWQYGAMDFSSSGSGVFERNEVSGGGVYVSGSAVVNIQDNVFGYDSIMGCNVYVVNRYAEVSIYRNLFHGGDIASICLAGMASISGSDNHILNDGGGFSIKLADYTNSYLSNVDLRNNYWGTADSDSIAAMIWDGNDDSTILQTVQFEPFSSVPLPTEKQSLDSFKALFR